MDWTTNPLIAAYFAACHEAEHDGAIYCYYPKYYVNPDHAKFDDMTFVASYTPRSITQRIVNQGGVFTFHPDPGLPLTTEAEGEDKNPPSLIQIAIPQQSKQKLLYTLDSYGINEARVFPGLDGLSRYINWQTCRIKSERDAKRQK